MIFPTCLTNRRSQGSSLHSPSTCSFAFIQFATQRETRQASGHRASNSQRRQGFHMCIKRHASANPAPTVWLGIDTETSVYVVDSLCHADQPQSCAVFRLARIEAYALVTDLKFKLPGNFLQTHCEVLLTAVLHSIA